MEGSLKTYEAYRARALSELKQLKEMADQLMPETCFSRAYYAVFYAIKAQLALNGINSKSHKQAQIDFRKRFIKTKLIDSRYSKLLSTIFEKRERADYDVLWVADINEFKSLLKDIESFVHTVLNLNVKK